MRTPADALRDPRPGDVSDTAPQPPPVCCDPSAPIVKCCVCGADVHTCERTEPVDNDYRCPAHGKGVELSEGEWVCSDACGYERMLAGYVARIAALEAQLAEAQAGETAKTVTGALVEKRDRYIRQLEEKIARQRDDLRKEKELRDEAEKGRRLSMEVNAKLRDELAEAQERLAMGHWLATSILKREDALKSAGQVAIATIISRAREFESATAEAVAQHTASVERRGAAKELRRISETSIHTITLYPNASGPGKEYRLVLCEALEARAAELEGA